jgi:hypothetical protein
MKGPSHLVEKVQVAYFSENLLEPRSWVAKADELWQAAEILRVTLEPRWQKTRDDPSWRYGGGNAPLGLNAVRLMLCAYALENLLKAVLVTSLSPEERKQVESDGSLPGRLGSHDLNSLVSMAGLTVTADETAQLERLSEAAVAFGRYPLPKKATQLFAEESPAQQSKDSNEVVDADMTTPGALFGRLRERFR